MTTEQNLKSGLTFTMPFSNVLHLPFADKVKATRLAGFQELSIQPQEVLRLVASGLSIRDMRAIAEENGIRVSRLDPLCSWNPNWHPNNMDDGFIADHSTTASEFFGIALALGCTQMSLNATFTADAYAVDDLVTHYTEICRLAHEHGLICDLEPIPMWGVKSLEQGWEIVERAGAPNGGLVLDTLHFVRSESKLETLASIPGDSIHCVQICDGIHPLKAGVTLEADCFERMWPGTGNFPLQRIVSALHAIGGLNGVGPEVFSVMNQNMSAEDVAQLCKQSLLAYPELRA
ncbi:sugar phosphate isomerase/epimerase family protein [Pseudomonas sp. NPDC089996]|uniref:sugar phosphate isomerase/epimerase family protein n=1 Tax=Pseudomonas sp. NPDC089996 TaxID=3364474 RepID=UPI00381AF663